MFDLAGWLRRLGLELPAGDAGEARSLATLLTPSALRGERPFWQAAAAAATLGAIAVAALIGLVGAALVTLALGALLFLCTEILGLDLEIDPRAFGRFGGFSGFGGAGD
ncbi:MAG TPA: hypothetical protein VG389_01470 [Myxococcota bacterium]|jgi:hypothetical protein|nr:hypothetical protein [Myxococcota bacterium]